MDADPDGRMICELSNWTGKAYRIPRGKVKNCADRQELKSTAVYLLFGKAESSTTKPKVYIGEAENVYGRLVQHVAEKEFWNESVVFISKDENLNKAHIKYLESRLFEIATLTARYELQNSNTPTRSSISESDQSELEEFIEYIKMLINTMGFKVFEPFIKDSLVASVNSENLYIKSTKGANACGKRVADGFVIFKGTIITNDIVPSLSKGFKALRDELIENKLINEVNGKLEFMSDYLFSSPSSAAAVVLGRNANGLMEWKDNQGKELKAIEAQEIQQT
ncbi:MAG: GIY-YIG nuclease family protein [Methylococcaceae bacterium]|nr:MAG: GIY-YIG nuclease family protein [Methylococcaceae bacterium]